MVVLDCSLRDSGGIDIQTREEICAEISASTCSPARLWWVHLQYPVG